MKKTLLSILFAMMIVIGLCGILFEMAIFYDREFGGNYRTLEISLNEPKNNSISYSLVKTMVDYMEENGIEKLKSLCNRRDIKFAIYEQNGRPIGRLMGPNEESSAKEIDYSTENNDYTVRLYFGEKKSNYSNSFWGKTWLFIREHIYREIIWSVVSLASLICGTILFVLYASTLVKYVLIVGFILSVISIVAIMGGDCDEEEIIVTAIGLMAISVVPGAIYIKKLSKLERAVKEIADGNTNLKMDVKKYPISLKNFAEEINLISDSVYNAVNERLKSERFKTELITNVSHDIKTPLTSIINFSDLIVKEGTTEEERVEYADHLHKQSVRLKELLEALIEASKAATGAVELNMAPCDVHILLEQCVVEYEHKLNLADVTLMESYPEEKLMISADAKFLSRIFENLLTNICKYAMPGSRAYVSAKKLDNNAVISFKNMSKEPLNFTMEELTERFVRGDISRHTEGHGLGLSIVKSLMDLQNGELKMQADADLFIVELSFPLIEIESEEIATEETGQ